MMANAAFASCIPAVWADVVRHVFLVVLDVTSSTMGRRRLRNGFSFLRLLAFAKDAIHLAFAFMGCPSFLLAGAPAIGRELAIRASLLGVIHTSVVIAYPHGGQD